MQFNFRAELQFLEMQDIKHIISFAAYMSSVKTHKPQQT